MAATQIGKIAVTTGGAWNASTAYPVITVVTSADGKSSYISKKDVPAGTALTNAEYWQKIVEAADVEVDPTLTQEGESADAKATGDALALKADKTALAKTDRHVDILYKLTQGQAWDTEDDTTEAYSKAIPAGSHAVAVQMIGGKSDVQDGELVSAAVESVEFAGFNLFDGEVEIGGISTTNGGNIAQTDRHRFKNYVPVKPETMYYFYRSTAKAHIVFFYDSNRALISSVDLGTANGQFLTPANTAFVRFVIKETSMTPNICVNISNASLNGTYKAHVEPKYFGVPAAVRALTSYGCSAGAVCNSAEYDEATGKWSYVQRVGERAYQSGDESDTTVITDGTTTHYPLSEPVTTDITDLMPADNLVECEAGGTVTFEQSETALAVPNKLTYFIKLQEAI